MEKHIFKKKYGQNFLQNEDILNKIIDLFEVDESSKIVEVGPGDGALTKKLLYKDVPVIAFEIDESLKQFLDKIKNNNFKVIYKDFLTINLNDYFDKKDKLFFVANIPYYITTPIITKFIDDDIIPEVMILMVQKEVGERLSAKPKTREYGAITAILNYYFDITYEFTVDRKEFYPIPNVDSCIIKLSKKSNIDKTDFQEYKKLVYDAFKQKRKNLKNNLKNYDLEQISSIISNYDLDLTNRAEDLSSDVFIEITKNIKERKKHEWKRNKRNTKSIWYRWWIDRYTNR